ncbi:hypothetical protein MtrunA17_Chr2g0290971 [Medicago truncatula]|uniref:Uncharacterized protein n=1 Tax=Medicago truncatula TaxID=3880 RepID=A2Q5F1_MEDTR|nr:hypothetical protein MtrDRAFT_AC161399g54v2 [Medicago truncatula]RHN72732.1 hypothetical protein MtrunA17_Chr2g0290971 [Medicago truncatula]
MGCNDSSLCKSWSWSSCVTGIPTHAQLLISRTMPDEVTFMGLLLAFSHAGLINQGRRVFGSIKGTYNLNRKVDHYSCLVDIL